MRSREHVRRHLPVSRLQPRSNGLGSGLLFLYMPQVYGYAVFQGIQAPYLKTFSIDTAHLVHRATTNILGALNGDGYARADVSAVPSTSPRSIFCSSPPPAPLLPYISVFLHFLHLLSGQRVYAPRFALVRNQEPVEWLPFVVSLLYWGL